MALVDGYSRCRKLAELSSARLAESEVLEERKQRSERLD